MTLPVMTFAERLRAGAPVSADVSLAEFRDLYNQLQGGAEEWRSRSWVIVLLGHQAVAQPLGRSNASFYIKALTGTYLTRDDFAFAESPNSDIVGSTDGRYTMWQFVRDIVQPRGIRLCALLLLLLSLAMYQFVPWTAQEAVATSLLSALAIFVTIFVLFVLAVDPEKEYGYLRQGRFRKLAETDKHIATVGVVTLFLAVADVGFLAAFPSSVPEWGRVVGAFVTGTTIDLAFASFWLVINYHFSRKHEMTEMRMASVYVANAQKAFDSRTRASSAGITHLRLTGSEEVKAD